MAEIPAIGATAPPPPSELRPAKINDRFIAYLLDTVPFLMGFYGAYVVVLAKAPDWVKFKYFLPLWIFIWVQLYWDYQFLGNLAGGTLGKKLMGLRVVRKDGTPLGGGRSLLRAFGSLISTPFCNFGYVIALLHPESRALHDMLSGSLVIEAEPKMAAESWIVFFAALLTVLALFGGTFYFTFTTPLPSDIRAVDKAREGLAIMAKIQESYKAEHGTYTDSLPQLAQASGDVEQFKSAMLELFDPNLFQLQAGKTSYRISAAAKDRFKTRVVIEGP